MAPPISDIAWASALTSLLVGLIALVLAVSAWRARARSGNRQLGFVGAAFVLFLAKSLVSTADVLTPFPHAVPHDALELVLSLFDLAILGLLFLPLALKR